MVTVVSENDVPLNDVVSENAAHGRIFFLLMLSLQSNHRSISAEYVMSPHTTMQRQVLLFLVERKRESGTALEISIFSFSSVLFFPNA